MTSPGMVFALFAKIDMQVQGQPIGKGTGLVLSDLFLIVAIALALFIVLVLWAKYLRNQKTRRRRSGGEKVYRDSNDAGAEEEDEPEEQRASADSRRRYKYRYRRRSHRSRNPTLAETGGLPPSRPEGTAQTPQ